MKRATAVWWIEVAGVMGLITASNRLPEADYWHWPEWVSWTVFAVGMGLWTLSWELRKQ